MNPFLSVLLLAATGLWTNGFSQSYTTPFEGFTARGLGTIAEAETNVAGHTPVMGPLKASGNPNYFEDGSGRPLILCGSQTWNTLQDWGTGGAVQALDFEAFVSFLKAHGHN